MAHSGKHEGQVLHRSGAAARRANLPAATLRVWERRYSVIGPLRSEAGQRLYSEADVQRLKLLKRAVDRGYAIGTVASLPLPQLELLALAPASALAAQGTLAARWAVIGRAFDERLMPYASAIRNHRVFQDVSAALTDLEPGTANVVIVHCPSLREDVAQAIVALSQRHPDACFAAVYSFGVVAALSQLRSAGIRLVREPLTAPQLIHLVEDLVRSAGSRATLEQPAIRRMPRLFSDDVLGLIERQAASVSCECPGHLTSIISQLSAFEMYSDGCISKNPTDAALHTHMGDVTSQARALFESLLQRVAAQEGWPLDAPPPPALK